MLLNKNSKLIKQTKPLKMVGIIMSNWNFTIGVNTMHLAISNATITKNIEQAKRIEVYVQLFLSALDEIWTPCQ
jgi:hypothetical protein